MRVVSLRLTRRELQILTLIGQGLSDPDIAKDLGITAGTVKVYGSKLRLKLGRFPALRHFLETMSNGRVAMANIAVSLGLAEIPEKIRLTDSFCQECQARMIMGIEPLEHECLPKGGASPYEIRGHAGDPQNKKVQVTCHQF